MTNIISGVSRVDISNLKPFKKPVDISFEGKRTDYNLVNQLTEDNGALFKPKEREIISAIERLSKDSSSDNIWFLLNVAQNNQYGVRKGSHLDKFLHRKASIKDMPEVQNVDWEALLKNAIESAIKKNRSNDRNKLIKEFEKLFSSEEKKSSTAWVSLNPNINFERRLITLRNSIINSKHFTNSDDEANKKETIKHLDYFIASSEVAFSEKNECLKQLNYFMSEDYSINPQLKAKRVQILSEILNDLVIKTPQNNILEIKKMNQRFHGMCAAISTSRKAMAHEHKFAYVTNLIAELDDKEYTEVYDVTDPKEKDFIIVPKAKIDYNAANDQGYRIVDAAVSNWMNIANQMGNGLRQSGYFVAFDPEHYGMFSDAHLNQDMDSEHQPKYTLLRATIKVKNLIKDLETELKIREDATRELKSLSYDNNLFYNQTIKKVKAILSENINLPVKISDEQLTKIANLILDPKTIKQELEKYTLLLNSTDDKNKKDEYKKKINDIKQILIDHREGPVVKKQKISTIIVNEFSQIPESLLNIAVNEIFEHYTFIESRKNNEDSLASKFTNKGKFRLQQMFFELAAYNRVRTEFELDIPERLELISKDLKVKPDKKVVLQKLENMGLIYSREKLDKIKAIIDRINNHNKNHINNSEKGYIPSNELYAPMQEFNTFFKEVQKSIKETRRIVIRDHKVLNKELDALLSKIYDDRGKAQGDLWVGEEGDSGLYENQFSRLLKQQSGDDHFLSMDPKEVLDHIEAGKGGSVSSTMVDDYQFSGHAQYVYDVTKKKVLDSETSKVREERVLYHDNTWGHLEVKDGATWKGDDGNLRTDYGCGSGGPNGYLLDSTMTQGTTESDMINGTGIHKPELFDKDWAKKIDPSIGEEYPLFYSVILRGKLVSAQRKAEGLIESIKSINSKESDKFVSVFFDRIMYGNSLLIENYSKTLLKELNEVALIHLKSLNKELLKVEIENNIEKVTNKLSKNIFKPNTYNTFKTELTNEIYDKLCEIIASDQSIILKKAIIFEAISEVITQKVNHNIQKEGKVHLKIDEFIDKKSEDLLKKLLTTIRGNKPLDLQADIKNNLFKNGGIKTKEDFDKLPDTDLIKIIINKIIMKDFTYDNEADLAVTLAKTPEDLKNAHALIVRKQREEYRDFFNKSESSIEKICLNFAENAIDEISKIEKAEERDLSNLKELIKTLSNKAFSKNNGSASKLKKQLQTNIDRVLKEELDNTGKIISQKLKATINKALNNALETTNNVYFYYPTIEDIVNEYPVLGPQIVNWVDLKFDPNNDEEFTDRIKKLQDLDRDKFEQLIVKSTPQDLGIKYSDPYYLLQKVRGLNEQALKQFENAVFNHVYYQYLEQNVKKDVDDIVQKHQIWLKTPEAKNLTPHDREKKLVDEIEDYLTYKTDLDTMYRTLSNEISHLNMDKFVKSQKQQSVEKDLVRPSFPIIKVASDEDMLGVINSYLDRIDKLAHSLGELKKDEKNNINNEKVLKSIKLLIEKTEKEIKDAQVTIIKGLMRARHQDDIMREINNWVKITSKYSDANNAREKRKQLEQLMLENHNFNHVEEFLKEIVVELPRLSKDKDISETNTKVINLWKESLTKCIRAAKIAQMEYDIRDLIQQCKMPQVAKKLRDSYSGVLTDDKTSIMIPLESKQGIDFLFSSLKDPVNDNRTLKYFIEQSGLTETAIKHFINYTNPAKVSNKIETCSQILKSYEEDQNQIQTMFEEFIEGLSNNIGNNTSVETNIISKLTRDYFSNLNYLFSENDNKSSKILNSYKYLFNEELNLLLSNHSQINKTDIENMFVEIQEKVLQKQESVINEPINKINIELNHIQEQYNALKMLDELVPDYCDLKSELKEVTNTIEKELININEAISTIPKHISRNISNK
ncbi:MAG: hypothetical protein AB1782_07690 [Cyanobacteriota bacterium]